LPTNWITLAAAAVTVAGGLAQAAAPADFSLTDTAGKTHRLADARGHYVVLNFWATWCVPCIQEIPEIAEFQRAHPEVEVIGVAQDVQDATKVKQFAKKVHHTYPLVLSDDAVDRQLGAVRALPTTRIYDAQGKLVYDQAARVTRRKLEELTASR
jgi:thiol-disulfide isomerase/thioredoxin